jgi:hypothetical protein
MSLSWPSTARSRAEGVGMGCGNEICSGFKTISSRASLECWRNNLKRLFPYSKAVLMLRPFALYDHPKGFADQEQHP